MKRSELFTILVIALVVVLGGLFLLRPKQQESDPRHESAQVIPPEPAHVEPLPPTPVAPPPTKVEPPAPQPVAAAVDDHDAKNVAEPSPAPQSDSPSVYAANAELAPGVLPAILANAYSRGVSPHGEACLKAGETVRHQEKDARGQSLEEAIRSFIAAQPEAKDVKYLVSCGAELCEVQMEQKKVEPPAPGATPQPGATELVSLHLNMQPWFWSALTGVCNVHFVKDGHPYFAGYWKLR